MNMSLFYNGKVLGGGFNGGFLSFPLPSDIGIEKDDNTTESVA